MLVRCKSDCLHILLSQRPVSRLPAVLSHWHSLSNLAGDMEARTRDERVQRVRCPYVTGGVRIAGVWNGSSSVTQDSLPFPFTIPFPPPRPFTTPATPRPLPAKTTMGFFKRFLSLGSSKSRKNKKKQNAQAAGGSRAVDAEGRIVQSVSARPAQQDPDTSATRLLRSTSTKFSVMAEFDYASLPPLRKSDWDVLSEMVLMV